MGSLDCLAPRGLMVSFGNASGAVPPFDIGLLSQKGSLFLTRPTLGHYTATRPELEAAAQALFEVVLKGDVRIPVERRYSLAEAARAHREMEARSTSGAGVLIP
jgi:NADPH2:quinone reductase